MDRPDDADSPETGPGQPIEFVSPGKHSIHNPSVHLPASSAPAVTLALGEQSAISLHSRKLVQLAQRTIRIHSAHFEAWLYNDAVLVQQCRDFLLQHQQNRLHILLQDNQQLLQDGQHLLALAERLSSRIRIRLTRPEHEVPAEQWLSVDGHGMLLRKTSSPCQGHIFYHQPGRVRPYVECFDILWNLSRADINLRRMML